jgi:hypothetical protein
MTKREKLLMAAVAGIAMGAATPRPAAAQDKGEVKCWGINGCGSEAKCAVTAQDLDAFKTLLGEKDYAAKYGKSTVHGCAGKAECGGAHGRLNWRMAAPGDCKAKGGFLVEEVAGKKVAKKA